MKQIVYGPDYTKKAERSPADAETIKTAKAALMELYGWNEPQAYRAIQKVSMHKRLSMAQISWGIIKRNQRTLSAVYLAGNCLIASKEAGGADGHAITPGPGVGHRIHNEAL